jgi:streptogramin lyase
VEAGVTPNTLVRFDPRTATFQTWTIPSGGGIVRHMVARPDGSLVLACSGVNKIALVQPGAGRVAVQVGRIIGRSN